MCTVYQQRGIGGVRGGVPGWGMGPGWVGEGLYRVPSQLESGGIYQRSGPRKSLAGAGVGGYMLQRPRTSGTTPAGPGRAGLPSLYLLEQIPASGPIRRDSTSFPVKLVKRPRCHQNMSKRPVIVPNHKTGSESRLLIFWDFSFGQPSLTRN